MPKQPSLATDIKIWVKNGPFTFNRAAELAIRCASDDSDHLHDTLNECLHKFSEPEFSKLLCPIKWLEKDDFEQWESGTLNWQVDNTTGKLHSWQLALIAQSSNNQYASNIRAEDMDYQDKLAVFEIHNRSVRARRLRSKRAKRDNSPVRE